MYINNYVSKFKLEIPKSHKLAFQNTSFSKGMMKYWLESHMPYVNSIHEHEQDWWVFLPQTASITALECKSALDALQVASLCWWQNSML